MRYLTASIRLCLMAPVLTPSPRNLCCGMHCTLRNNSVQLGFQINFTIVFMRWLPQMNVVEMMYKLESH